MKAKEFNDFCVRHNACKEWLAEIQGLSAAEWWEKTERGDWMEWLAAVIGIYIETSALLYYQRMIASARSEYERVITSARFEYQRMIASARSEYEHTALITWPQSYQRMIDPARSEYERAIAPARSKYERVKALELRRILGNPFVKMEK